LDNAQQKMKEKIWVCYEDEFRKNSNDLQLLMTLTLKLKQALARVRSNHVNFQENIKIHEEMKELLAKQGIQINVPFNNDGNDEVVKLLAELEELKENFSSNSRTHKTSLQKQ